MLAESTLAAQEAVIQYLAAAAGLQQWGQASLAFLTLQKSEHGLSTHQLSEAIESTLEDSFRVRVLPVMSHRLAQSTISVCRQRLGIFSGRGLEAESVACLLACLLDAQNAVECIVLSGALAVQRWSAPDSCL